MSQHLDDVFEGLPSLLDVPTVAGLLGMTNKAIYAWLRQGKLPGYKLNGSWVIVRDELRDQLAAGSNQPPPSEE